jgi:hypothetical protein
MKHEHCKGKDFQHLPPDKNPQFSEDGARIFYQMRSKYPLDSIEDLDNILNGICASLIYLIKSNVEKEDHKQFLQLIHRILTKNLDL